MNNCINNTDNNTIPSPSAFNVTYEHVKDWEKLQEAVFARLQSNLIGTFTTSDFVALMLSTMCYGYLPDTTTVLSDVDAIDAMIPLLIP